MYYLALPFFRRHFSLYLARSYAYDSSLECFRPPPPIPTARLRHLLASNATLASVHFDRS
jgi:hypothetical protein